MVKPSDVSVCEKWNHVCSHGIRFFLLQMEKRTNSETLYLPLIVEEPNIYKTLLTNRIDNKPVAHMYLHWGIY